MKKDFSTTIQGPKIKTIINQLLELNAQEEQVTPAMIELMKTMRELFIELEQPTIVKSIRLAFQHIEKFGNLDNLPYWSDEELEFDMTASTYEYYIRLMLNPLNRFNKEEIKEINIQLKEMAS
jgi:hypothetical protein